MRMISIRGFDITVVKPKVNKARLQRRTKHPFTSFHREEKTYAHTTIGGKGRLARLVKGTVIKP